MTAKRILTEAAPAGPDEGHGPAGWPAVLDGELMTAGEATIPATDEGLIRGDGAFDAFRLYRGRPFARSAHLDRLERSCGALELDCPRAEIERDLDVLVAQAGARDAAVRVILTRGGHRLCLLESLGDPAELGRPARLLPVTYDPSVLLNGVKSLSYAANMLASRRARRHGYDEALLVRSDGVVLEGPTCSIFWVSGGCLRTPALETGVLASITRRLLIEGAVVEEGAFALEDLLGAQEAFLASTARDAQPVAQVGERTLPAAPGPRTRAAQQLLQRAMTDQTLA
ncbi:MAG: aminotransferase class IV [Actinomycetota bacterium]|nr:aminotransferase class IV [Actinomycetota bacterium]